MFVAVALAVALAAPVEVEETVMEAEPTEAHDMDGQEGFLAYLIIKWIKKLKSYSYRSYDSDYWDY